MPSGPAPERIGQFSPRLDADDLFAATSALIADELTELRRLFHVRHHRTPPDMRPMHAHALSRALHFKGVKPGRDIPEPRRVETRRDVVLEQVRKVQAARFGRFPFPGFCAF